MDVADGPNLERVFKIMLQKPYNGRVQFNRLSLMSPPDFQEMQGVQAKKFWFREHDETFAIFTCDNGKAAMCGIRLKKAKLCRKYLGQGCLDVDCKLLHLCTGFVDQRCMARGPCRLSHSLEDEHNKESLRSSGLDEHIPSDVLKIIRRSQPEVCFFYNRDGVCNQHSMCVRLHVCKDFILGKCAGDARSEENVPAKTCSLSHSLTSTHSLRLLNIFGVWYDPEDLTTVRSQILVPADKMKDVNLPAWATMYNSIVDSFQKDKKGNHDLDDFLAKSKLPTKSKEGTKPPRLWSVEFADIWFEFDAPANKEIEERYCDPKEDHVTVEMPSGIRELLPELNTLTLNFETNKALLEDGSQELTIRRSESSENAGGYVWYFLKQEGQWEILDEVDRVEDAFKKKDRRINILSDGDHKFRAKFEDMTLKDRNTGETHKLKRRPKLIE